MFHLNKLTNSIKTLVGTWCLAEVASAKPYVKLFWPKFGHGEAKNNPQSVKVLVETIAKNEM